MLENDMCLISYINLLACYGLLNLYVCHVAGIFQTVWNLNGVNLFATTLVNYSTPHLRTSVIVVRKNSDGVKISFDHLYLIWRYLRTKRSHNIFEASLSDLNSIQAAFTYDNAIILFSILNVEQNICPLETLVIQIPWFLPVMHSTTNQTNQFVLRVTDRNNNTILNF